MSVWKRFIIGVVLGAGAYGLYRFVMTQSSARRDAREPEGDDSDVPNTGFFDKARDEQLAYLTTHIARGDACWDVQREARARGHFALLQELWVALLEEADTLVASVDPGLDVVSFKEQLLYVIRDGFEPDNKLIARLGAYYHFEKHAFTRMRIVRAIGRIGGAKAIDFLRTVTESDDTMAADEARRWL